MSACIFLLFSGGDMKTEKSAGYVLFVLFSMLLVFPVFAGNYPGEPDAAERCERERETLLAPERERLIEKCVATKKDVAYCENYYRDYGAGGMGAGGKYRSRKFNNIPDCQAAKKEAQRNRTSTEGITRGRDAIDFTTRDTKSGSSWRDLEEGSSGRDGSAPSSR